MLDKLKEILDSNNKVAYSLLVAIVIVIIVMIILICFIWKNMFINNNDNKDAIIDFSTGKYKWKDVSTKDVITIYASNLAKLFENAKIDDIYSLVSKDYLEYKNMDKDAFYRHLKFKKIYMQKLKIGKYIYSSHYRLGNIFEVEFMTLDNSVVEKILFIEKSPNNYVISFDSFIGFDKSKKTITRDGLELTIKSIKEFVSEIEIEANLRNVSGGKLIINKKNYYEPYYLKFTNNKEIMSSSSNFKGITKEMNVTNYFFPVMNFRIERLASGNIKSIVIKDVYSEITKECKNIEFDLR